MKKIFLLILACSLAACAKVDYVEEYSGSRERTYSIAETYLKKIATDLIPDYLISLESALSYDRYGYYETSYGTSSYETGGKSILTPGTVWKVDAKKKVAGLSITCKGEGIWELSRQGAYPFFDKEEEGEYITGCQATAQMLEDLGHGHYNWKISFSGSRSERSGYRCLFQSTPELIYTCEQSRDYTWDGCGGSITMIIDKDGEKVDMTRMDFDGKQTVFFRGL